MIINHIVQLWHFKTAPRSSLLRDLSDAEYCHHVDATFYLWWDQCLCVRIFRTQRKAQQSWHLKLLRFVFDLRLFLFCQIFHQRIEIFDTLVLDCLLWTTYGEINISILTFLKLAWWTSTVFISHVTGLHRSNDTMFVLQWV